MRATYLVPRKVFLEKMSRVRFHQIKEIAKLVDLVWSGPGWDNYKNNECVTDNLLRIYNGNLPDFIIGFDHRDMKQFHACQVPKVNMMNEMHDPNGSKKAGLDMLLSAGYDFIVCHHKNEMEDAVFDPIRNKLVNIPHHVDTSIFRDYGLSKTTDVLLCGSLVLQKYRLRKRFVSVIEELSKKGYAAKIHQHPGGHHADAHTDKYLVDFAKAINASKICLTCSSIYKCAFAKYVEIPLCGSLLAGDVPDERCNFFQSFMLCLDENKSNGDFVNDIEDMLLDDEKRNKLTKIGMEQNQQYSMDKYAVKFVDAVFKFLAKRNGIL